jgi:phosphoribosylformylglycinamidine synthase
MIEYFRTASTVVYSVVFTETPDPADLKKLCWLFGKGSYPSGKSLNGIFSGPRREMITPWSTNAVEITRSMGITGIERIEELQETSKDAEFDRMLQMIYENPDQHIFKIHHEPEPVRSVDDIRGYNEREGLALNEEEVSYLEGVSRTLGRPLTDSEVFGFSQVNSEHCRHKIFNGTFVIGGSEMPESLFQLIKKTSKQNPGFLVSAYKDNVAFIEGPRVWQFAPDRQDQAGFFKISEFESVISLKAETHNFPTTVEPFNGAATGSGGEIRDRLAGGRGSLPLAGTAVYMTSYPRLGNGHGWEKKITPRHWLYQSPAQILIRASDGASDFGNKFGQPLINGSVLTFEHEEGDVQLGFDKVIMLAGGIGFGKKSDSKKANLKAGDFIVLLGGDNYRIGMGGGAVSSVGTGEYANAIELNAIQRSNPEMQKRVMNAIRAMVEADQNPIISIHDHGAGGHLNCFSELLEQTGGEIRINDLPVGDPTLSDKEIISNESQERMGLAISEKDLGFLKTVADRERAPIYSVGMATGDHRLVFSNGSRRPVDLELQHLFGNSPKTILTDEIVPVDFQPVSEAGDFRERLKDVLRLESVACKDWLTNKVDRSVTGKVATQQTCGAIQLPLNNLGVMAIDYQSYSGIGTAIGHAPAAALINPGAGSRLAVSEALLNLVWAPLQHGLSGVSLSANWMWPAKNPGENARLYAAVDALSEFVCALGINVPTGKDSLSMTQKYPDGKMVKSPGTVIVSAVAEVGDIRKTVSPAIQPANGSMLVLIDFSDGTAALGGSAFAQTAGLLGDLVPEPCDAAGFKKAFEAVQMLISNDLVLAGHDVSSGGLITTLLEMCFSSTDAGAELDFSGGSSLNTEAFTEKPAVVVQVSPDKIKDVLELLEKSAVSHKKIGTINQSGKIDIRHEHATIALSVAEMREVWFETSARLDALQRPESYALKRAGNIFNQALSYKFASSFEGSYASFGANPYRNNFSGIKAAIIREKGVNGDREMAYALWLAGFDVKDIHMTDLVSGREDLSDVRMIVFVGGFSNSDVLGSAKGWAGAFLYNEKAKRALDAFYKRNDTLSLGVCNGCQLMMELGLVYPRLGNHPVMHHNGSGRFESAFVNVSIPENNSVMLGSLSGSRLGVWLAHGEGRFLLEGVDDLKVAVKYSYESYPGNPNDSDQAVAALCSDDGRHLAMMPHLERSLFPWNWPYYPSDRKQIDALSPWMEAFSNAFNWVRKSENR